MNMPQTRRKTYDSPEAVDAVLQLYSLFFIFFSVEWRTTAEASTLQYLYLYLGDSTRFTRLWKPRISLLTPSYIT